MAAYDRGFSSGGGAARDGERTVRIGGGKDAYERYETVATRRTFQIDLAADDDLAVGRITAGGGHSWVADNDAMWAFFAARTRPQN